MPPALIQKKEKSQRVPLYEIAVDVQYHSKCLILGAFRQDEIGQ